jgi:hypothetical protein
MPANVTNDLIYTVLKQIQEDTAELKKADLRHDEQFSGIRHVLAAMQSDALRHDAMLAARGRTSTRSSTA